MTKLKHKIVGGKILEERESGIDYRKVEKFQPTSNDVEAYLSKHAPSPMLRLSAFGDVEYMNDRAQDLFNSLSLEERGLELYRLGVLAQKAINYREQSKVQYHICGADFRIVFVPLPEIKKADLYFTEISESVKIKNYFEVQAAFAQALFPAETIDEVAWIIVKQAIVRLGYEDCVVYLLDEDQRTLVQKAAHGPKNPRETLVSNPINLEVGKGIAGCAAANRKAEIVNDTSKDPRYVVDDAIRLSEIAVPLLDGEELLGVIDSEHPHRNFYTEDDLSILKAIASMAATKIQRIKSRDSIKAAEIKTRSLINAAFGGIYTLRGKRFEMVNRQFLEITGYAEKELTAEDFDMANLIHHVEAPGKQAMEERAKGDTERKSYQIEIRTKAGAIKRLAINTVIIKDEKGPYTLGIALDMSRILESERMLKETNEQLTRRNDELNQFTHLASHNLRAPVSNMIGLLDLFDRDELSEQNLQVIRAMDDNTFLLNHTLEEMHEVLKSRAGAEQSLTTVNLESILQRAKIKLKKEIHDSGMVIETKLEVNQFQYLAYHIENLFETLLANAIKYRDHNKALVLKILSEEKKDCIELRFEDNGSGTAYGTSNTQSVVDQLTDHESSNKKGIALHQLKQQLQHLGSKIRINSVPGHGTTVMVCIKTFSTKKA